MMTVSAIETEPLSYSIACPFSKSNGAQHRLGRCAFSQWVQQHMAIINESISWHCRKLPMLVLSEGLSVHGWNDMVACPFQSIQWRWTRDLKFHSPARSGGRQITTERAQRARWWFGAGDRALSRRGYETFSPNPQGISQAALRVGDSGGLLVVVINGLVLQCLHKLRMQWSTRRSTRDPFALCSRSKKKRPLLATRHMHDGPPYKRRKQELTTRSGKSSFAMTSPGICLLSVAIHVCTFAFSQR